MVNRSLAAVSLAASALLFASVAGAESKSKGKKPQQVVPTGAEDSPQAPALDPATEARLEQMTSRSDAGLIAVERPDGTISVDLEGRFQNVLVVAPTEEGGHAAACLTGPEAKKQLKKGAPARTGAKIAPKTPRPLEEM